MNNRSNRQKRVYAAVVKRGYRKAWTAGQFAARQVAKLTEELAELSHTTRPGGGTKPMGWRRSLDEAGYDAKWAFDNYEWTNTTIADLDQAKKELADIQVVVFCLAEALAEMTGRPFDVTRAAFDKATQDIERGVR